MGYVVVAFVAVVVMVVVVWQGYKRIQPWLSGITSIKSSQLNYGGVGV